ncbi:spore gernimation protein [Gordoniibacillus kamchatkensis]|uniref:Spore gernimation protein n=1 Tax=Gordoniibacillus kamchatkensis TaxID=1590651 RepID=A0ABR5ADA2_9BACL|nr:endospore germination permease [Paenibacillus sp. VKM B-2647]KIL39016.1 spore gernimation protein [Paenibacillus sp. VKM B-2647]
MEKGNISAFQLAIMMYPGVLATGFLSLPTITAQYAKNDLWLTGIFAFFVGLASVYMAIRLHELYPKMTVIQYSEQIVGKIPGKMIGVAYFLYFFHGSGAITRQYAEFVTGNFLFHTPIVFVICSMLLLCSFAVRGGTEMLARSAVILTPVFVLPMFFLSLLGADLDVKNILPVLSHGIMPVLKGTISPQAWVSEFFIMSFFLPRLTDPGKIKKWGFISLCIVIFSMIYVNLLTLFVLGPDTANKTYPILAAFRYIRIGDFFENLEALLLAMWVAGNFVKIGVFYYAAVMSFSQWLELSDYRPVVFPVGIVIASFSFWDLPSFIHYSSYVRMEAPFEITTIFFGIPLLLFVIALIRNKKDPANLNANK